MFKLLAHLIKKLSRHRFVRTKLGYRWSIYIVRGDNELCYLMHHDSVFVLVGLIENYFSTFGGPKYPYSIYLNFNFNHTAFKIDSTWFKSNGDPADKLIEKIEEVDPDWVEGSIKGVNSSLPDLLIPVSFEKLKRDEILSQIFKR